MAAATMCCYFSRMDNTVAEAFLIPIKLDGRDTRTAKSNTHKWIGFSLCARTSAPPEEEGNDNNDKIDKNSIKGDEDLNNKLSHHSYRVVHHQDDPYTRLFATNEWKIRPKPTEGHVNIFKQDTPDEGVHSIEYPVGSGKNSILAFESERDCLEFASALREMDFFEPQVRKRDCVMIVLPCF